MGPTSFNVGDLLNTVPLLAAERASMGPTSFNVGDVDAEAKRIREPLASMGPTSFNVGDKIVNHGGKLPRALQWGRRLSTSETCLLCVFHLLSRHRFNGADVFQRRRQSATALP